MKKVHRFITDFTSDEGLIKISDKELVHQIVKILKFRSGEQIIIGKGDGIDILANIIKVDKSAVLLEPQRSIRNENEPKRRVELYCSILKKENFEAAAQKAVEVGVAKIVPVITNRTVKMKINTERLKKIIKEAAEQSGRGIIPELGEIADFETAVSGVKNVDAKIFFDPSGERFSPLANGAANAGVFIGPEGGWTDEEIKFAKDNGFRIVSLGPLVMRSETAVVVAAYLSIHNLFGENDI